LQADLNGYVAESEELQQEHARTMEALTAAAEENLARHQEQSRLQLHQMLAEEKVDTYKHARIHIQA